LDRANEERVARSKRYVRTLACGEVSHGCIPSAIISHPHFGRKSDGLVRFLRLPASRRPFTLVAALVSERILTRDTLTLRDAQRILNSDRVFGIAAGVVLVIGILRVAFFEKGPQYYEHSAPFIAKIVLFAIVGLLSIYPTLQFLSWRKALAQGEVPDVSEDKMNRIRLILRLELAGVALIILCAALMARGIGSFG
jgi:putative membrane protein